MEQRIKAIFYLFLIIVGSLALCIFFFLEGGVLGILIGLISLAIFLMTIFLIIQSIIKNRNNKYVVNINKDKINTIERGVNIQYPKEFIILDIETTGLHPAKCEITEIGAIVVDSTSMEVIRKFNHLVNIKGDVPPFITRLTGITKQMLNKGKPLKDVLVDLDAFCGDLDIYAHNSPFDKRFVRHYLNVHGISYQESEWKDTIKIFKQVLPGRTTYKLESLIIDLGVDNKENHRAFDDAVMTLKCLKKASENI